ncbi:hypothetical protein KR009_008231, partial [Drosophila setifemur]
MTQLKDEVQVFNKGEIVLCYEPDKTKAKVLYTSKVLAVFERRTDNGLKYFDYKIHFQGWRPSYDREVRASVLLKFNDENSRLQKELAVAAKLQIRADNSYKGTPDKSPAPKKKRTGRGVGAYVEEPAVDPLESLTLPTAQHRQDMPPTTRNPAASRTRDHSGGRKEEAAPVDNRKKGARGRRTGVQQPEMLEITPPHVPQEDRVILRISERLREYMEYDYDMVVKLGKQHAMPASMPIVKILENFVKQRAVELAIGIKQDSSRARNTKSHVERMYQEYNRVMAKVCMLKEVVDGIRIYFEFHLDDHLLYTEEKEYAYNYLTDENMEKCSIALNDSYDYINTGDTELLSMDGTPVESNKSNGLEAGMFGGIEYEKQLQKCLSYIVKFTGTAHAYDQRTSPFTAAYKLPVEMRGFLCETFNWRLILAESPPEKSMIFGAPHLARMMGELWSIFQCRTEINSLALPVKLPQFLNASAISNQKLEDLLPLLDGFINYLENHREWFDKENYVHPVTPPVE